MLRIFEAIKKSPFFNGNYPFCPFPKNAPAEIFADAQLISECHATEDDLSSDDWHLYTKNFPLETPILKPCRFSVE